MNTTTSLIALVILLIAYALVKRGKGSERQKKRPGKRPQHKANTVVRKRVPKSEFHAVAIKFSKNACAAAKSMSSQRFLSNAAPHLPLPECNVMKCDCRFVHYKDRRSDNDRRNAFRGSLGVGSGEYESEKREVKDRREEPPDEF